MKWKYSTFFLLFSAFFLQGQINLVKNPSFEQYSTCPRTINQIFYANFWNGIDNNVNDTDQCNGEYYNVCADTITGDYEGVPGFGSYLNYQYPHSGNSYIGIDLYSNLSAIPWVQRTYAKGNLSQTLISGKTYCFKMWVNLSNLSKYAADNMQVYIDNGSIDTARCGMPIAINPQIKNASGNILTDTLNWVSIKGSFVATGNENSVTIGNFSTNAQTQFSTFNPNGFWSHESYYLVDDVSLIATDLPAWAGKDTSTCVGDSIYIGRSPEIGLDNVWTEIHTGNVAGHGAGVWVKPDTSTTYVVTQDLCGAVTHDTIRVTVNCIGVREYSKNALINIYPNPASTVLNIKMGIQNETAEIKIVDLLGNEVLNQKLEVKSNITQIDINCLKEGIYFTNIITLQGITAKKIIVQR
jgi:hypothetical protein